MDPTTAPPALRSEIEKAVAALRALTAMHQGTWHIDRADWNVDQESGTVEFACPAGVRAVAPVQIIGTWSSQDGTWLWGWDHPSVLPALTDHARLVLEFGRANGFEVLTTRKFACSEEQCWEFAALACHLAKAQGAYRGPTGAARVFMTFGEVTLSRSR